MAKTTQQLAAKQAVRYVGMDVHADTVVIAIADTGRSAPDIIGTYPNE
jgi:hypothetical protein